MNTRRFFRNLVLAAITVFCSFSLIGCEGEYAVPITSGATRSVDPRLVGNWASKDGKDKIAVRRFDDSNYVVSIDGDHYRAFHSDLGTTAFISAQDIDSSSRKYSYLAYRLSDDGKRLFVRTVNSKVISKDAASSSAVQKLLKANLKNTELFEEETELGKVNSQK